MPSGVSIESRWSTAYGGSSSLGGSFGYYGSPDQPTHEFIVQEIEASSIPSQMLPNDTSWSNSSPDSGIDSQTDTVESRLGDIDSSDFLPDTSGTWTSTSNWSRDYDYYVNYYHYPDEIDPTYQYDVSVNGLTEYKTGSWWDLRLRSDVPSDTRTSVSFLIVNTQEGQTSSVGAQTLTIPAGQNTPRYSTTGGSGGIVQLHPSLNQGDNAGTTAYPVSIKPDANMAGVIGDVVASAQEDSVVWHFVTPKKSQELAQEHVILTASGITADKITAGNPNQIAESADANSELLERLKTINESLPDRRVDPASPEGIFLDSLPNRKPFSRDVLNQLTLMVDIKRKVRPTTEPPSITAQAPCVQALIASRAQSIEPIDTALKREDLPSKIRTILEELQTLVPKILAADEWRKTRKAQRARPTPSNA